MHRYLVRPFPNVLEAGFVSALIFGSLLGTIWLEITRPPTIIPTKWQDPVTPDPIGLFRHAERHSLPPESHGKTTGREDLQQIMDDVRHLVCIRCSVCCQRHDSHRYGHLHVIHPRGIHLEAEELQSLRERAHRAGIQHAIAESSTPQERIQAAELNGWLFRPNRINPEGDLSDRCGTLRRRARDRGVDVPAMVYETAVDNAYNASSPAHSGMPLAGLMGLVARQKDTELPFAECAWGIEQASKRYEQQHPMLTKFALEYATKIRGHSPSAQIMEPELRRCWPEFLGKLISVWDLDEFRELLRNWWTPDQDFQEECTTFPDYMAQPLRQVVRNWLANVTGFRDFERRFGNVEITSLDDILDELSAVLETVFLAHDPILVDPVMIYGLSGYYRYILAPSALDKATNGLLKCHVHKTFFERVDFDLKQGKLPTGKAFYEATGLVFLGNLLGYQEMDPSTLNLLFRSMPLTAPGVQELLRS